MIECKTVASYLGFETFCGSCRVNASSLVPCACLPGKSGLMNKHIVQGQCFIFGALCPSKSGLMNKHTVKQAYDTHGPSSWCPVPCCGSCRANVSFEVLCTRLSPN